MVFELLKSFFLGFLQGASEFLPISSSGHLSVFEKWFSVGHLFSFTVMLHFGTLLSMLIFYRPLFTFKNLCSKFDENMFLKALTASFPVMGGGFFFYETIKSIFNHINISGWGFIFTGAFLLSLRFSKNQKKGRFKLQNINFKEVSYKKAFIIGCFQVLALLPGVSRSGISAGAAIHLGIHPNTAVHFSFLMGFFALGSAFTLEVFRAKFVELFNFPSLLGCASAAIFGYLSLSLMHSFSNHIYKFSFYLLPLGLAVLVFFS